LSHINDFTFIAHAQKRPSEKRKHDTATTDVTPRDQSFAAHSVATMRETLYGWYPAARGLYTTTTSDAFGECTPFYLAACENQIKICRFEETFAKYADIQNP